MGGGDPNWLTEARALCRTAGIEIAGWGDDALMVYAESPERARDIAATLAPLGLRPVEDEDASAVGMLTLSHDPVALRTKVISGDISHRRVGELLEPLIEAAAASALLYSSATGHRYAVLLAVGGTAMALHFPWHALQTWGWKVDIQPEALRVRLRFRWSTFPWDQIRSVEWSDAEGTREPVGLTLASGRSEAFGKFNFIYARQLRDRLRHELEQKTGGVTQNKG